MLLDNCLKDDALDDMRYLIDYAHDDTCYLKDGALDCRCYLKDGAHGDRRYLKDGAHDDRRYLKDGALDDLSVFGAFFGRLGFKVIVHFAWTNHVLSAKSIPTYKLLQR